MTRSFLMSFVSRWRVEIQSGAWVGRFAVLSLALLGCSGEVRAQTAPPHAAVRPLVFDGVTVIDVVQGRRLPAQRVVVIGTRIRAVGSAGTVPLPPGAQVIDARGKFLIPGLWDMHTHSNRATNVFYPLFVANGVTGIRDMWSWVPLDTLRLLQREILAGTRVGPPRQFLAGAALDDGDCSRDRGAGHMCVKSGDTADVRLVVDSLKAAGADFIKTYDLSAETYFLVAAEVRRIGIRFGGHDQETTAIEAADSGAMSLDHINTAADLDQVCLPGATTTPTSKADCQTIAEHFRRNNTWWCPTLVAFGETSYYKLFGPMSRAIFARVELAVHDVEYGTVPRVDWLQTPAQSTGAGSLVAVNDPVKGGFLRLVHQVELPIIAGTDVIQGFMLPGYALHAELAIYVASGLTPLEALQSATLNPTKAIRGTDSLGTVAAGKLADLVLLDADPLVDITNTTRIRAVVANGRYYDRAALDQLLAVAIGHHDTPATLP